MRLSKGKYDSVWTVTLALGLSAAWEFRSPLLQVRVLSLTSLAFGLVGAVLLSLYVEREGECEEPVVSGFALPDTAAEDLKSVSLGDVSSDDLTGAEIVREEEPVTRGRITMPLWDNFALAESKHINLTWLRVERYSGHFVSSRRTAERLNLLEDAVHIAKQLKGTGLQVGVAKDFIIVGEDLTSEQVSSSDLPEPVFRPKLALNELIH